MQKKFFIFLLMLIYNTDLFSTPLFYFCTAADQKYFSHLINLLGSIFRIHDNEIGAIAIFDLGLKPEQRNFLNTIQKTTVYDVEKVHPDITTPLPRFAGSRAYIAGLYAWKPVIMKQALDMFPYILYMDAGTTVLNRLDNLFKHIIEHGYFLTDCGHDIRWMTTRYVINQFNLESPENKWILDKSTCGTAGSPQGLTHAVYNNYILPMYELAKSMRSFIDDGTTPNGYGTGRHDQTLFSVLSRLLNLTIHIQDNGDGCMIKLDVDRKTIPMHMTWNPKLVRPETVIFSSRSFIPNIEYYKQFLRFKDKNQ